MIVEQILVTFMAVFCYLVVDEETKEAILIDPAGDFESIMPVVKKHNAKVKYIVNTHGHPDHTSGNGRAAELTGATILIHQSDAYMLRGSLANVSYIKDRDIISIGKTTLRVIHTPGHSEGGVWLFGDGHVFTGDTLFTEGMGRTDIGDGSMRKIMDSIQNRILTLPDETVICPGHHYGRLPTSTVLEQKKFYR
jgi:prepilin-type processing-associated H-X9-DG protein